MENKDNHKKYQSTSASKPIYKYKPIAFYSKASDDEHDDNEEEFSYAINDKKIKALKEKKIKKHNKVIKVNETEDKNTTKNESINKDSENKTEQVLKQKEISKKKKKIIKKKKIKKENKDIPTTPIKDIKKDEEQETIANNFYEYIHKEGDFIKTNTLNNLKEEEKEDIKEE